MMKAAKPTSMLWAAHVLPIYVTCFDLSEDKAMQLLVDMDLLEWVQGAKKTAILKDVTMKFSQVFLCDSSAPSQGYANSYTDVPDQR
jgi:hypothetical protein